MMGGMGGMGGGVGVMEPNGAKGLSLRTFESLKNKGYRIFWFSMLAQMAAMNMQMVARSLLIYEVTKSATMLGAVALASAIPMLAFSLFGGVIADRVEKKYVMIVGQAALCLVALLTAVLISLDKITGLNLMALGFAQGVIFALAMPARQAAVPSLVGRSDLMNALSLNMAGMNINRLVAPALAGFLVVWSGGIGVQAYAPAHYVMAALYVVGGVILLFLPKMGVMSLKGKGALSDMVMGVQYLRQNSTVLMLLLITLVGVVLSMSYFVLLPIFTKDIWHVGPGGFGVLMSVSGIGAIVGSLALASIGNSKRGLLYLGFMLLTGIALTLLAFSPSYQMALVVIVIVGLAQAGRMTLSSTLIQYYTEEAYQGRVMSIYLMEFGLTSFASFGTALLVAPIGPQWAIGSGAIALIVLTVLAYFGVPKLRQLD